MSTRVIMTAEQTRLPVTFVINGAPRTKKNHGRRLKRGKKTFTVPSEAYEFWNTLAVTQLQKEFKGEPIEQQVNCRAIFLRHANVGDAVGYYQGLADTLQNAGVLKDDKQIVSWDGTRLGKDAQNPRVIVTLEVAA